MLFLQDVKENISTEERDVVTRGWRKPHNEEVHNLFFSFSLLPYLGACSRFGA
jgi:hypothetical protein